MAIEKHKKLTSKRGIRACLKNMDQLCYFNKMAIEAI